MKEEQHPIDELFSQHLKYASAPVADDMWERIANAREQKRRPKMMGWWGAIAGVVVGVLTFVTMPKEKPEVESFPVAIQSEEVAIVTDEVQSSVIWTHETKASHSLANEEAFIDESVAAVTKQEEEVVVVEAEPNPIGSASLQEEGFHKELETNEVDVASLTLEVLEKPVVAAEDVLEIRPKRTEKESRKIGGPHRRSSNAVVAELPQKTYELPSMKVPGLFSNHQLRCARFTPPNWRFDLEVLAGPAYAQQLLSAKTVEAIPHLKERTNSEEAGVSINTSVRMMASTKVGLTIRTGLNYAEINDRFVEEIGSRMDVSTIFDSNGEVIGMDTIYLEAVLSKSNNKLKFVELPLLLGYEHRWAKMRVGVNAGLMLGMFFDAKGKVLSPATSEVIALGQEGDRNVLPIFINRPSAAFYGAVSLIYNLHSRYSLMAEPYFKTYASPLSTSDYGLKQNYIISGVQLGLRMRL